MCSPTVRELIRDERDSDLPAVVSNSRSDGMQSFTQALAELVEKEWIAVQTAMDYAPNRDALKSMLKGVQVKSASLVGRIKG